ncbi:BZ3500_MvSof-1268-A1-R1_Chr6-3g08845 [Microbotryum saponariae]|uniref:BZ3500_MvSof-1268-A1-R1_Chr6-3g08845 protein n=1 Tax=Microbotryum saponariae TaxID=289078 RepID=A0A2X0MPA4_9BASI|nr:BZ3500_MvSof-1268-A1-R1_Chr6-3g08845 [Microbotryum saponariae]SDA07446.1 BZ3501_MvSof-1269-A2-R1_Chr6-2g08548 [Microbotryum saponariae]
MSVAALHTNSDTFNRRQALERSSMPPRRFLDRGLDPILAASRNTELVQRLRFFVDAFGRPGQVALHSWISVSEAKRTQVGLIALFGVVFTVWNLKSARTLAVKYLWQSPLQSRTVTLLTSVFAHKTLSHLAFNSVALFTIGSSCSACFDRMDCALPRSTSRYEYIAFFTTAGIFASLASRLYSLTFLLRRSSVLLPSLGASGAIWGCFVVTALAFPQVSSATVSAKASVALIFMPFVPVPIGSACCAMLVVDVLGVIRGWQIFDHVAHLGGALFGLLYYVKGHALFEQLRQSLLGP